MTTSNEESRSAHQFYNANSERHTTENRNYGYERRQSYESHGSARRLYNQQSTGRTHNRSRDDATQGKFSTNQEGTPRKRRPRVGERTSGYRRGPEEIKTTGTGRSRTKRADRYPVKSSGKGLKRKTVQAD